jgi:hypothetical protein
MVHCGHEPTAVDQTFRSPRGLFATVSAMLSRYPSPRAAGNLEAQKSKVLGPRAHLVQLGCASDLQDRVA